MDDYYDSGNYTREIPTRSAQAQSWFDRGHLVTSGDVIPGSPADSPAYHVGENELFGRSRLAKLIDKLLHFWLRHWKFLILAAIAIAGVVATVIRSS